MPAFRGKPYPAVQRIAREYAGRLLVVKVNVDEKQEIAKRFQIQAIPAILLFWKGAPVMRLQGALPYAALKKSLEENWPAGASRA